MCPTKFHPRNFKNEREINLYKISIMILFFMYFRRRWLVCVLVILHQFVVCLLQDCTNAILANTFSYLCRASTILSWLNFFMFTPYLLSFDFWSFFFLPWSDLYYGYLHANFFAPTANRIYGYFTSFLSRLSRVCNIESLAQLFSCYGGHILS